MENRLHTRPKKWETLELELGGKAMTMRSSSRKRRPLVSVAWMTHPNTPFITERLVDGRLRSVARRQIFQETEAQGEQRMLTLYGGRWMGNSETPLKFA